MFRKLRASSLLALPFMAVAVLAMTESSQAHDIETFAPDSARTIVAESTIASSDTTDLVANGSGDDKNSPDSTDAPLGSSVIANLDPAERADLANAVAVKAATLAELVAQQSLPAKLDAEMQCLATAVYFETRGESLLGQLAVARVVINRAKSSRFPNSMCGVIHQRHQFSFVQGGRVPPVRSAQAWNRSVAIAQIAMEEGWDNPAEGALFFHARYVSPGWRLKRLAAVDNHVFYQ